MTALLSLAWEYQSLGEDFSFEADAALYEEALRICRDLSDKCARDAKNRALQLIREYDLYDEDEIWDYAMDEGDNNVLARFDMAGSHLLKLLDLWVAVALSNGFTKEYTRISILRYIGNPYASGLFGKVQKDILRWGRGFDRNLIDQLSVIGQNTIVDAARYAEYLDAVGNGATYYIRRRGSNYVCPECDDLCGEPIPIEEPFIRTHSRCMCWPEYHYSPIPEE